MLKGMLNTKLPHEESPLIGKCQTLKTFSAESIDNILFFYSQLCLEEFNYEIEKVINAVLEGKLPPSLIDIDRCMKR